MIGKLLCWLDFHKHPKEYAPAWWDCQRKDCDARRRQRWY